MHGRKKVEISDAEKEAKTKERAKKLQIYLKIRDAIFEKREKCIYDEEGLKLTGQVLAVNPDIYTFWNYRKLALQHLLSVKKAPDETTNENSDSMLSKELELTEICLENNPKSYGAWHHRGWVLTQMKNADFKKEIKQCEQALVLDERNFHCWDHWRIVCKLANVSIEDQIKFSDKKVKENFSNYSAWHYRSTLLPNLFSDPDGVLPVSNEKFLSELEMVHNANFTDPDDQSTWFYRNWLFKRIDQVDSTSSVPLTDNIRKNLEFDLNQMLELSQLEKDKKWPLLIAVTCMKMLDFEKYEGKIFAGLASLKTIDPMRRNFYDDLLCKWRKEKEITL